MIAGADRGGDILGRAMDRDFRQGNLELNFSIEPWLSIGAIIVRATSLFFATLPFLTAVTLAVCLPGKLVLQFACYMLDLPTDGWISYIVMDIGDLALSALVVPATIYGLVHRFRTGKTAPLTESLRWGRRQWAKTLWNKFKVEITIGLYSLLLIVPGIVAAVRLVFADVIVAVEGDDTSAVLDRSRDLSRGRGWRIFAAILPALPLGLLQTLAALGALKYSRFLMAGADSIAAVLDQWMTIAVLLLYLPLAAPAKQPATRQRKTA